MLTQAGEGRGEGETTSAGAPGKGEDMAVDVTCSLSAVSARKGEEGEDEFPLGPDGAGKGG